MHKNFFSILIILLIILVGCDRESDNNSTTFLDNGVEGTPVTGFPAPTPFSPSPSIADLTITPADLNVTLGTAHTFSIDIFGVAGNGSLASTNLEFASSGMVIGLPVSINFSDPFIIGPATYRATGTFSGVLDGSGTINVTIIYSEDSLTVSRSFVFLVGGTVPGAENCSDSLDNDFDGLTDCADPDCDGDLVSCPEETIFYHDGAPADTGLACPTSTSASYLVHFAAVALTPPFDLTEIAYEIFDTSSTGALMDVVAYTVAGGVPGTEIGRVTGVASATPVGTYVVTIPPGTITITTTEFFAGFETNASETGGVFMGRDETAPIGGPGVGSSFISAPSCGFTTPMDLTDIGDPTLDGDWIITVTISQ